MTSTDKDRDGREHPGAADSEVRISNWSLATGSTPGQRSRHQGFAMEQTFEILVNELVMD